MNPRNYYLKNISMKTIGIIGAIVLVVLILFGIKYFNKDKKMSMQEETNKMTDTTMEEQGVMVGGAAMLPNRDIVDNAVLADNVTTVVAAIQAADLVETLKGAGPFTVFAPTNTAFEKLPEGTVETLLKPENKDSLTSILTYHVVAGRYTASDLTDGQMLKTVNGQSIKITKKDGKIWINDSAMVETADVISRNGVTFVIDTVLMPESN